jgi:hypothetical protein
VRSQVALSFTDDVDLVFYHRPTLVSHHEGTEARHGVSALA